MFPKITKKNTRTLLSLVSIATAGLSFVNTANATIVEIKTSLSDESIKVNLFDKTTPKTIKNFLNYVDTNHYTNSVVHRVSPGFVVQAGGFEFNGTWPLTALVPNAPVVNEPIYSNVKGTIAMAKQSNDINSATNQWFFNLADNSTNLDRQNGGFTAFGQVIEGFDIIEKIALLDLCTNGGLQGIPMLISSTQTCANLTVPGSENFVVIESINVIDSSEVTDSNLNPLLTKYPDSDGDGVKDIDDAFPSDPNKSVPDVEDSGGSMTWFTIAILGLLASRKRFFKF
ncbi:MAG TPA: peptidylprolyl isomerase [Colwellia sp.]|nr:peptidylprolyl isomerase [Colwellia sp.]